MSCAYRPASTCALQDGLYRKRRQNRHFEHLQGFYEQMRSKKSRFLCNLLLKQSLLQLAPRQRWGACEFILCFYWRHTDFFHACAAASSFTLQD